MGAFDTQTGKTSLVPAELASEQEGVSIGCTLTNAKEKRKGATVTFKRIADGWQLIGIERTSL